MFLPFKIFEKHETNPHKILLHPMNEVSLWPLHWWGRGSSITKLICGRGKKWGHVCLTPGSTYFVLCLGGGCRQGAWHQTGYQDLLCSPDALYHRSQVVSGEALARSRAYRKQTCCLLSNSLFEHQISWENCLQVLEHPTGFFLKVQKRFTSVSY